MDVIFFSSQTLYSGLPILGVLTAMSWILSFPREGRRMKWWNWLLVALTVALGAGTLVAFGLIESDGSPFPLKIEEGVNQQA